MSLEEALVKTEGKMDRWLLRLGKSEEEAGKFEPFFLPHETFAEDFTAFLVCLNLTKLVESITDRMQAQKKGVREVKKKLKAEQKEIAKMKAKVEAAAVKAQKKLDRTAERERIKAEAKKNREEAKLAKKQKLEQSKSVNEIPGMAEATKDNAVVAENAQMAELPEPHIPKVADVVFEETPVVRRPFSIPEEG